MPTSPLLVYYYLAEVLTLQEVISALPDVAANVKQAADLLDRFNLLRTLANDPHHDLQPEILHVCLPTVLFLEAAGTQVTEVSELGCSFFSATDQVRLCAWLLDASIDARQIRWAAIDHSGFFLRGALAFHPGDRLERFMDYTDCVPEVP